MIHPRDLEIKDFTYDLPDERIARFPLSNRDESKLLVYKDNEITTSSYAQLPLFLPENSTLVFNDTKVVQARLHFQKQTGAIIEVFCLEPADEYADISLAMAQTKRVKWKCLIGGASKWKHGMVLEKVVPLKNGEMRLSASIIERLPDCFVVLFEWEPRLFSFSEILQLAGSMPLPPYLHRPVETTDKERYQTVYAINDGSVAAPTAGLHFTEALFEKLKQRQISREFVTLHVSAGTFKPVSAHRIADHEMHSEFIDVSAKAINHIAESFSHGIFAVGTTSLRTLESLYWMGVKVQTGKTDISGIAVDQWDPYEIDTSLSAHDALSYLLKWMEANQLPRLVTKTRIMIAPGYRLRIASGLVTNFHQPQSTLLLLIAAITGDKWKELYAYALANDYRFLSYGDGCLLYANQKPNSTD